MLPSLLKKNRGIYKISLILMAVFYCVAGLNHFRVPEMYEPMMPPFLPAHGTLIFLSGIAELFLGLGLLWPKTQKYAAWGIIALLIAVFPANFYMYLIRESAFPTIPEWILIARLPFQLVLMAWAYTYTKPAPAAA